MLTYTGLTPAHYKIWMMFRHVGRERRRSDRDLSAQPIAGTVHVRIDGRTVYRSRKYFRSSPPSIHASLLASRPRVTSLTTADDEGCVEPRKREKNYGMLNGLSLAEFLYTAGEIPNTSTESHQVHAVSVPSARSGFKLQQAMMTYTNGSGGGGKTPSLVHIQ